MPGGSSLAGGYPARAHLAAYTARVPRHILKEHLSLAISSLSLDPPVGLRL